MSNTAELTTPKTKKKRTPSEKDSALFDKRAADIAEAVADWRRINDDWAQSGDQDPGIEWFSAAANIIGAFADGPLPPWARRATNSVKRLATALCRVGEKPSVDWNLEQPTGPMLEPLEFVERVIAERDLQPPEFETPGELATVEGAAGTKVSKSQMAKICRLTPSQISEELKAPGSICDEAWKQKRADDWRAEREAECMAEDDSHVLAGLTGQLAALGLE